MTTRETQLIVGSRRLFSQAFRAGKPTKFLRSKLIASLADLSGGMQSAVFSDLKFREFAPRRLCSTPWFFASLNVNRMRKNLTDLRREVPCVC
jgi:hypothetical protein